MEHETPAAPGAVKLTISKNFTFEAAHRFEHTPEGHPFARLHGHSFEGTLVITGDAAADSGFVRDFWDIDAIIGEALESFDHGYLNDVEDLPTPSLENIAMTLFARFSRLLPGVVAVEVRRPSCGETARVTR